MVDDFAKFGSNSIIVWPNLGKPTLVSISSEEIEDLESFKIEIILTALPEKDASAIREEITNHIFAYSILGLDPDTKRGIRSKKFPVLIEEITSFPAIKLSDPDALGKGINHCTDKQILWGVEPLRDSFLKLNTFENRTVPFKIMLDIPLSKETKVYLSDNSFILFDLAQYFKDIALVPRMLYHSICLTTNLTWENFSFIQISDLHVAKRNDEMLGVIVKEFNSSFAKSIAQFYDQGVKQIGQRLKSLFTKKRKEAEEESEIQVDPEEDYNVPIEQRFRNPNNMFRRFIRFANLLASSHKLDFLVMTGDLVDFCIRSDYDEDLPPFVYENTNWVRFIDLVLNRAPTPRKGFELIGLEPTEELLVPFFTVVGNHDYRANHYSISTLGIHRFLGITSVEAFTYGDVNKSINPLYSPLESMIAYNQYVNPYQDYCLKLGQNVFIFLDSGSDSITEIKYLLMADPSLSGFSNDQITYMNTIATNLMDQTEHGRSFLSCHAPILNPMLKQDFQIRFLQNLKRIPKFDLEDFKESRLREFGEKDPRSDIDLEYHSGTIAENWVSVMEFMDHYKVMALNGHTHKWLEFRTEPSATPSTSHTGYGKPIQNPFAIYWDDYAKLYMNDQDFFDANLPLYFQTPALGIQNRQWKLPPGGYRVVEIKNNRIFRMNVNFVGTNRFLQKWHLD